ncbi:hypothetical protein PM10SUCC1_28290 [Propionigenium maris DSM 9537]|uniref:Exodeoxyribonuclease X-like C-terminal domain-containing protein n=1 Tax=Propionigenium maris DSM 9537 TaxID=1123000 RepID=A0A9W6GNR3_9FUSO|nr:Rad52/Rad22 family DNA repair protein [Propionigenium maris]GLI57315.1 hypothetical protein PM10SUCC1_28290 [Propionigenium maris DSM 9537]
MNKSMEDIVKELKAPFDENKIEFKVGATNQEKTMGLALAYVEARAIQERLDEVVGFTNWSVSYREVQGGFLCCLSLRINGEWIAKEDGAQVTEYESLKGGISSAFKRVASSGWGIGRYLYDVESRWYSIRKRGKSYEFTINPTIATQPKGEMPPNNRQLNNQEEIQDKLKKSLLMKVSFGKYKGLSLGEIFELDYRYIQYLIDKSRDTSLVNACSYLKLKYGKN